MKTNPLPRIPKMRQRERKARRTPTLTSTIISVRFKGQRFVRWDANNCYLQWHQSFSHYKRIAMRQNLLASVGNGAISLKS